MLGHGAASLLGSPWSLLALSFAALADTKDDGADARETALDFAFVESMVFLAVVASPAGAGYVAGTYGERAAFALAAAVGLVSLLVHATMRDATKRAGRRDWVAYTPVGGLRYFCRDAHHGLIGLCCFLHWTGMDLYLESIGIDNPGLRPMIERMDDEHAKDFVEKLIIIGRFPRGKVKDLIDTLIRMQHKIKSPAAWLMTSMRKEQPCRFFVLTGVCQAGMNCKYKHTRDVPEGWDGANF